MAWFAEKKCPICGKNFCYYQEHIYKYKKNKVCSYGCELKAKREGLTKKEKNIKNI